MYTVYVLINSTAGQEESVRKNLLGIEGAKMADTVTGAFDNIAVFEGEDLDELLSRVLTKVRTISGVTRTETLVARRQE
jgi:uncharacterized protein with GYD domain